MLALLKRQIDPVINIVFLVLLLVIGTLTYLFSIQLVEMEHWVEHTHQVIDELRNLTLDVRDLQYTQHGYVIFTDKSIQETYSTAKHSINNNINRIRNLTSDNQTQRINVAAVQDSIEKYEKFSDANINLKQQYVEQTASDIARSSQLKILASKIQQQINKMEAEESRLLDIRSHRLKQTAHSLQLIIFFAAALALVLMFLTMWARGMYSAARRRAQRDLESFRQVTAAVKDYAMFVLDPKGHVITWNNGAERIKGYRANEIIGKHFSIFYPESDIRNNKPNRELETALSEGRIEDIGWRIRKDGTRFWARVVITPVCDEEKKLIGFLKVTQDLTDARRAEENLIEARNAAVENANLKSQFVANISHEIRTPVSAVIGMSELLTANKLDGENKELAEYILKSSNRLLGIVNDLLDFSKIEANKLELIRTNFSIEPIVQDVLQSVKLQAAEKGITVNAHIDSNLPPVLVGAADRIQQVLFNLVHNAVKFTDDGSIDLKITIQNQFSSGLQLLFAVTDTGIGISDEAQRKLFQPFIQADGSMTRKYGGTGLGLSICKGLVELLGGEIGLSSEEGLGSTFWFSIPVEVAAELVPQ